jgi:hypothetical protein
MTAFEQLAEIARPTTVINDAPDIKLAQFIHVSTPLVLHFACAKAPGNAAEFVLDAICAWFSFYLIYVFAEGKEYL